MMGKREKKPIVHITGNLPYSDEHERTGNNWDPIRDQIENTANADYEYKKEEQKKGTERAVTRQCIVYVTNCKNQKSMYAMSVV
jgi:hypothetical protein